MSRPRVPHALKTLLTAFMLLAHGPATRAAPQSGWRNLTAGDAVEREIGGAESHSYRVTLAAGEFFHARVTERGVDVLVKVYGPGGQYLFTADGWYSSGEPDRVSLLAEVAGEYRLEVRALDKDARRGRYELKVEELRPGAARDSERVAAERILDEGMESAFGQNTPQSRRAAAGKLQAALEFWRRSADRRMEAYTLLLTSYIYNGLEDYEQSSKYADAALQLYRSLGAGPGQFRALQMKAWVHTFTNDNHKAAEALAQALALCPAVVSDAEEGRACEANIRFDTGYNFLVLGDYQEALRQYDRVLPLARGLKWTHLEGLTLHNYGWVYAELGEYAKAMDYLARSLPLLRPRAGNHYGYAYALNNSAFVRRATGDGRGALELLDEALGRMRALHNRRGEAFTLDAIGFTYASLGEREQSLEHYRQALPLWRAAGDRDGEANTLAGIAWAERERGDMAEARRRIEAALDITESVRGRVSREGLRSTYFATKRHYYEFYIDTLVRLHRQDPARGHDAAALRASERARARGLLESLAEAGTDIRQGVDPALLESERAARRGLNAAAARLTNPPAGRGPAEREGAEAELESALAEHRRLQERIRAESPAYAALTNPELSDLREIQSSVLDAGTLLLEYSLGEERSYLFAVTHTSLKIYEVPARAIVEKAAREVYGLLAARNRRVEGEPPRAWQRRVAEADRAYAQAAERLSRMLLGPAAAELGDKRLLIVAEGALQYIPFGALPSPAARGGGIAGRRVGANDMAASPRPPSPHGRRAPEARPLILDHEIVTIPSASVLALLRRERAARAPAPKAVAVLADPVFNVEDARVAGKVGALKPAGVVAAVGESSPVAPGAERTQVERSARESGIAVFQRLRFSRREAEALASLSGEGETLKALDFDASRATALGAGLGEYRVVHFATHGLLNSINPDLSGIVLSLVDEHGRPQDGFLRLNEIYNLRLKADLVVLSACQTALGREIKGEGLVGLTRGFMYAGAPRVVASLWKVDDRATAELMIRFYQKMLRDGLRPAGALRAAQLELRQDARWRAPYHWAAFTPQGEWR